MKKCRAVPIEERFWKHVQVTDTCWLWTGGTRSNGYGSVRLSRPRRIDNAHRVSYAMRYGPIPAGKIVCHRCDVPLCVRPDHLFIGSHAINMNDAIKKGRRLLGERHHKAKLCRSDVITIRKRYAAGESIKNIASDYPVHTSNIGYICRGAIWRHI